MKKILSGALALTLAASLAAPALAAPEGWTPADGARGELPKPEVVDVPVSKTYAATVTLDGKELDLAGIPGAKSGYVPMRAICEAADGVVEWYAEDNQALFFLDEQSILVDFNTMAVSHGFEVAEGVEPYLDPAGYTFLPVSFLNGLGQITVDDNPELDVERYDIKTSASDPMTAVSNSIIEASDVQNVGSVMPELLESLEFDMSNYVQLVARAPRMNIVSYTVFIAQVAEGRMDAAKADFQAFQDLQKQNFEHYLPGPYEMACNGQIVVSPDGEHLMLVISEHNDKAIEAFNAAYPAQ